MRNLIILCASVSAIALLSIEGTARGQTCSDLFSGAPAYNSLALMEDRTSIHIYSSRAKISAQESLPTLEKIISGLKRYKRLADTGTTTIAKIYKAVSPDLALAIEKAEALKTSPETNQDQIFQMAYVYARVVDFAGEYTKDVAYYADGIDGLDRFTENGYKEIQEQFNKRYEGDPLETLLPNFAKAQVKEWYKPQKHIRYTRFLVNGMYDEEPDKQNYFFQYKYVATSGVLPLRVLFQDRERGVAYYSVSSKPFSPADGEHHGSELFLEHDLFHAFFMKVRDLALFRRLGVTNAKAASQVKAINNDLLQKRIEEGDQLKDTNPELHAAIEAVFFGILHEQSMTYPLGMQDDLNSSERRKFYQRVISAAVSEGELGPKLQTLMKGREETLINAAMKWLAPRVNTDADMFAKRFTPQ